MKKGCFPLLYECLLLFLIVFSPLFNGSVPLIPFSVVQFAIILLALIFLINLFFLEEKRFFYPETLVFILIFAAIICIQLIPLPIAVIKLFSPKMAEIYSNYNLNGTAESFRTLTVYSYSTRYNLVNLLSLVLLFVISFNVVTSKKQLERIVVVTIIWAAILCFYGVVRRYLILGKLGLTPSFSTFGNKNAFGAYMTIIAPLSAGYSLYVQPRSKKIIFSFISAFIAAVIFISLARAAAISVVIAFVVLLFFSIQKKQNLSNKAMFLILFSFLFILLFIVGVSPVVANFFNAGHSFGVRLDILKDSLKMFKDYPIFGVGWGNFHYVFSQYRTFIGRAEYYRMHNELLQIVLETGILGGFFFLSFLFLTLKKIIQKTLTRHDPFTRNIVFSGIAGIIGLIIHSCSELDFHVPAIVVVLWIFLGIFYRCAFTKLEP